MAGDRLRSHVPFVHGFVRQHRGTGKIADREDVGHVGPSLRIHRDHAAIVDHDPRLVQSQISTVGDPAGRDQYGVVGDRFSGCVRPFEPRPQAVRTRVEARQAGVEQDAIEAASVISLPHLHQVTIGPRHQPIRGFDDVEAGPEGGIHRPQLKPDHTASDDQQTLRTLRQGERRGRVEDARIVGQAWQTRRARTRRDDRVCEAQRLWRVAAVDRERVWIGEPSVAAHDRHLARLRHRRQPRGEPTNRGILPSAQPIQVDHRLAERHPVGGERARGVDHRTGVEQRFRRNTADVQTHTPQRRMPFDQHRAQSEIGGAKRRRVAAGPRPQHQAIVRVAHSNVRRMSDNTPANALVKRAAAAPSMTR